MATIRKLRGRRSIFVSRVPWTVCRDTLREHFQQFGKITNTKIAFDKFTGRHRGFGFVEFESLESAKKALAIEYHEIEGSKVLVYPNEEPSEGSTEV